MNSDDKTEPEVSEPVIPAQVLVQVHHAKELQRRYIAQIEMGRAPKPRRAHRQKPVFFFGDTRAEVDLQVETFSAIMGPRTRGNKRHGRRSFYADLFSCLLTFNANGVTLPSSKNLSRKAIFLGLGDVLRGHRYTKLSDAALMKSSTSREKLARSIGRIFDRVSPIVKKYHLHISRL